MKLIKKKTSTLKCKSRSYVKLSKPQIEILVENYKLSNYPNHKMLTKLAKQLDFNYEKIESWFKNKRRIDSKKGVLENQKQSWFKKSQAQILKKKFELNILPSKLQYEKIADELGSDVKHVKNWYLHQRQIYYKKSKKIKFAKKISNQQLCDMNNNKNLQENLQNNQQQAPLQQQQQYQQQLQQQQQQKQLEQQHQNFSEQQQQFLQKEIQQTFPQQQFYFQIQNYIEADQTIVQAQHYFRNLFDQFNYNQYLTHCCQSEQNKTIFPKDLTKLLLFKFQSQNN